METKIYHLRFIKEKKRNVALLKKLSKTFNWAVVRAIEQLLPNYYAIVNLTQWE